MSKMDGLRAMREARYEAAQARAAAAKKTGTAKAPTAPAKAGAVKAAPVTPAAATRVETTQPDEPEAALCGHRNMSGRTCTREQGHAAKSHRYS